MAIFAAAPGETVPRDRPGRQRRPGRRAHRRRADQPAAPQDRNRSRPIRSIFRPCAASATGWRSRSEHAGRHGEERMTTTPSRQGVAGRPRHPRRLSALRPLARRPDAEGPLRPLADHHHHAGRAPPGPRRLRLHGAPLADGDRAAVGGGGRRHRRASSTSSRPIRRMPNYAEITRIATQRLGLNIAVLPPEPLPPAGPKPFFSLLDRTLSREITKQIGKPFWIDTVGRSNLVEIRIQLDNHVLRVFARRSQTYASNSLIFISWMVGTSLVLLAIAIIFLRNQIRPILRLAAAVDDFGKGRPVPNFSPRGAREVRQATVAFHEMRGRVERQIEQRTAMLAGVSHDLRTILTRFRLQLALLGDNRRHRGAEEGRRRHEPHARGLSRLRPRRRRRGHRADRHRRAAPRDRQRDPRLRPRGARHLLRRPDRQGPAAGLQALPRQSRQQCLPPRRQGHGHRHATRTAT